MLLTFIRPTHVPLALLRGLDATTACLRECRSGAWFSLLPTLKEVEEALLSEALSRADGHQGVAAVLLGLSRQALNKRLRRRQQLGRSAKPDA